MPLKPPRAGPIRAGVRVGTVAWPGDGADAGVRRLSSTDLDELCAVCDSVIVFFAGRICATLTGAERSAACTRC